MPRALREARARADVVLVDTAPILAASDAAHLIPGADEVLVVARAGVVTTSLAQQDARGPREAAVSADRRGAERRPGDRAATRVPGVLPEGPGPARGRRTGWGKPPPTVSLRKRIRSNMSGFLAHPAGVVWALLRYTDWWQPGTASVIQVGAARRNSSFSDGIPSGLLATLDERTELCRRMQQVSEAERQVLVPLVRASARGRGHRPELRISRRQCFRRRTSAIRKIVELGEPDRAA